MKDFVKVLELLTSSFLNDTKIKAQLAASNFEE